MHGATWATSGVLLRIPLFLVWSGIAARLLEPEEFGFLLLVISIAEAVSTLAQLGLPPLATRQLARTMGTREEAGARSYVRSSLRASLLASVVITAVLVVAGAVLDRLVLSPLAGVLPLAALIVLGRTFERLLSETYRGLHDIRGATVFGGLWTHGASTILFGAVLVTPVRASLPLAVTLYGVATTSSAVVAYLLLRHRLAPGEGRGPGALELVRESWPILLQQLLIIVIAQADLWIVAALLSPSDTALYGAALRVVALIALPLNVARQVVPPLVARMYRRRETADLQRLLRAVATIAGVPAAAAVGALVIAGPMVMGTVFGDFYRGAATILVALAVGQLINVAAGTAGVVLLQTGHQRALLVATAIGGGAMIAGAVTAAALDGTVGVAVAAAGGLSLQNILVVLAVRRHVGVWTMVGFRDALTALEAYRRDRASLTRNGSTSAPAP